MQNINRMLAHYRCELRACLRCEIIISIEEKGVFAGGMLDTGLAGEVKPLVALVGDGSDAWIFCCGMSDDFGSGIGAGVIDDNRLEIRKCLVAETVKALLEIIFDIICGDNDGNFRHIFPCSKIQNFKTGKSLTGGFP